MQSYELEALGLSLWGCEHDRVAANTAAQVGQCGMIRGKSDPCFRYPQRVLLNSQLVTSNGRRHLNVSRHCFLFQTSTVAQEMLSSIPPISDTSVQDGRRRNNPRYGRGTQGRPGRVVCHGPRATASPHPIRRASTLCRVCIPDITLWSNPYMVSTWTVSRSRLAEEF